MAIAEDVYRELKGMPVVKQTEILNFLHFIKRNKSFAKPRISNSQRVKRHTPKFGSAKGMLKISEDFDKPLEDMKEYMH